MFSWQMSGFEPNFESFSVFELEKYSSIQVGKQTGMGLQLKSFTTSNWETLPNMPQSGFKLTQIQIEVHDKRYTNTKLLQRDILPNMAECWFRLQDKLEIA